MCVIDYLYPATCSPKGHGSGSAVTKQRWSFPNSAPSSIIRSNLRTTMPSLWGFLISLPRSLEVREYNSGLGSAKRRFVRLSLAVRLSLLAFAKKIFPLGKRRRSDLLQEKS